jgi:hypothetical protein
MQKLDKSPVFKWWFFFSGNQTESGIWFVTVCVSKTYLMEAVEIGVWGSWWWNGGTGTENLRTPKFNGDGDDGSIGDLEVRALDNRGELAWNKSKVSIT